MLHKFAEGELAALGENKEVVPNGERCNGGG